MQKLVKDYLNELSKQQKKRRKIGVAVTLLVVLVIGSVVGVLMQYGVAMTGDAKCGIEEHTHTEECYTDELVCGQEEGEGHIHTDECYEMIQELICGQEESEEHAHTEECYQEVQGELVCGQDESEGHTHTEDCYEEQLTCGKEEHVHTDACYIDREADVEDASVWDAQYADTEWKGAWGEDLVTAAKAQIGYKESSDNYVGADDGSHKGYTRYGQFAGDAYTDWDAAFVNFCMYYAGLEALNLFPKVTDTADWYNEFQNGGSQNSDYLAAPQGYEPKAGDIIFMVRENEERDSQMGVVSSYNEETNEIKVIEGNSENEVRENKYRADDRYITAYLKLTEVEESYKDDGREKEDSEEAAKPETKESDNGGDEENWAYEESYDADKVIIHVKAKEGVVPKEAELSVTPIEQKEVTDDMTEAEAAETEKVNEQYELTNQKLEEESKKKDEKLEGFLAYDICFIVDGEEVEPSGEVKVTMDFKEAVVPETASNDSIITVNHLKENEDNEIKVEDLIDANVAIIETAEESVSVEKVELVANSFSIFAISWTVEGEQFPRGQLEVFHVDDDGQELISGSTTLPTGYEMEIGKKADLRDQLGWETITVEGKERPYEPYKIELGDGQNYVEVKEIAIEGETIQNGKISFFNNGLVGAYSMMDLMGNGMHLRVVYRPVELSNIEIINNIEETGNLDVALKGTALSQYNEAVDWNKDEKNAGSLKDIRYVWLKRVNSKDDDAFQKVENEEFSNDTFKITGDYGNSLNVALDEGSLREGERNSVEYKVELWIDKEKIATSVAESISYYNELRNGSFENPPYNTDSAQYSDKMPEKDVEGWKTTAPTGHIELANIGSDGYIHDSYYLRDNDAPKYPFSVPDGVQFAELNADSVGSLYQDVLVAKGTKMNYSFQHRARNRKPNEPWNEMYLVIVPTIVAKSGIKDSSFQRNNGDATIEIDTQKEVKYLIEHQDDKDENGEPLYPGVYTEFCRAYVNDWTKNEGIYIPKYDLNRFYFVSAESYYTTEGNFLDEVWFSQDLPKPKPDAFKFQLTKTISGIEDEEQIQTLKEKLKFNISAKNMVTGQKVELPVDKGEITGGMMTWSKLSKDTYIGIYNLPDIVVKTDQYVITVVEDRESAAVGSYKMDTTVSTELTEGKELTDTKEEGEASTGKNAKASIEKNAKASIEKNAKASIEKNAKALQTDEIKGEITVKRNTTAEMTFNNVYSEDKGFALTIEKRSSSTKKPLEGAVFTLTKADAPLEVLTGTSDTQGVVRGWKKGDTDYDTKNLNGEYTLKEIKAPDGYLSVGNMWTLKFENGKLYTDELKTSLNGQEDRIVLSENPESKTCTISIYNELIYSLPSTGGSGIYWYMFSGMLLMAGAALITYKKRCREVLKG